MQRCTRTTLDRIRTHTEKKKKKKLKMTLHIYLGIGGTRHHKACVFLSSLFRNSEVQIPTPFSSFLVPSIAPINRSMTKRISTRSLMATYPQGPQVITNFLLVKRETYSDILIPSTAPDTYLVPPASADSSAALPVTSKLNFSFPMCSYSAGHP